MGNREIKFRGLRTDGKGWVCGFYCNIQDKEHYILETCVLGLAWTEVIPESVGQFTGLKDKNGNEIYEGDVVFYHGSKGFVFYQNDTCMFLVKFPINCSQWSFDSMDEEIEIIGNIRQNPELI